MAKAKKNQMVFEQGLVKRSRMQVSFKFMPFGA